MSTHNIYFLGEIKKKYQYFWIKKSILLSAMYGENLQVRIKKNININRCKKEKECVIQCTFTQSCGNTMPYLSHFPEDK